MKIIDARVRMRTEELLRPWTTDLKPHFKDYIDLYKMRPRLTVMPVEDLIESISHLGIERVVICGNGFEDNRHIMEIARQHRETIPVCSIDSRSGIRAALKEIEMWAEEGSAAFCLAPHIDKLNANDRVYYPVYGMCEMLKKPVIVYGSMHFSRDSSMWHCQPQYIDEIAVDFPTLKIIVSHGGNGFGPPILAVAQRHPNVYLEFSALTPTYMAPEFLYATNTYLKRKCLFGTDYPLVDFGIAIDRWKKVIRKDVAELFFYQNVLDALYEEPR